MGNYPWTRNGPWRGYAKIITNLLKTGQTVSYATDDDGYLERGIEKDYTVLTIGQYSGTSNIVINGKTHALSNNCVKDLNTGLMWARYVATADIGPAANGQLFWEQWPLGPKIDISFANATSIINSAAGEFDILALCVGRKFTVSGSGHNDGTYTVTAITVNDITVAEALADEAAGASVSFATVDDLIWDALAQVNANNLGGFNDWRIPNYFELPKLVNIGNCSPAIDTTVFPSTPNDYHWTSSTYPCGSAYAFRVYFVSGSGSSGVKKTNKFYLRFVRS